MVPLPGASTLPPTGAGISKPAWRPPPARGPPCSRLLGDPPERGTSAMAIDGTGHVRPSETAVWAFSPQWLSIVDVAVGWPRWATTAAGVPSTLLLHVSRKPRDVTFSTLPKRARASGPRLPHTAFLAMLSLE